MQKIITLIVGLILLLMLAVPFVNQLARDVTNLTPVVNESVNINQPANNTYKTLASYPVDLSQTVRIENASAGALLTSANYRWQTTNTLENTGNGTIYFFNLPATWNSSSNNAQLKVSYWYQPTGYVTSSIGRLMYSYLSVFLIIAALVMVIMLGMQYVPR